MRNVTSISSTSNEVWNETFAQARWARAQGTARKLSRDAYQAQLRHYSERAVEVFGIWRAAWGPDASRLICVLAGHNENPWTAEAILGWKDAAQQADAWAVAPYFGHRFGREEGIEEVLRGGANELFAGLSQDVQAAMQKAAQHAQCAAKYGLPLLAYEGGQHLVGHGRAVEDERLTRLFHEANADPRMGQLYRSSLEAWKAAGGNLFVHWNSVGNWSRWGSWGALRHMYEGRDEAPKWDALLDFAARERPWW